MSDPVLPLVVAVPLGAAFLLPVLNWTRWGGKAAPVIGFLAMAFTLSGAARLWMGQDQVYWMGLWSPSRVVGISLVADGLSRFFLLLVNVIGFLVVIFSTRYMTRYTAPALFMSLFLLMMAGMNGTVISGDLFNVFVFLEIAAIASYALVAFGCESEELEASFKYLIVGTVGSTFLLFGIAIVYNGCGVLNMAQVSGVLAAQGGISPAIIVAAVFFVLGFGVKAAMVPLHAWLPDAHPSAPAPISAMLSGVLIKALGVYGICRIVFNVIGVEVPFGVILVVLGMISMYVGVLAAMGQSDLKRLLAYSSISQVGYVMLGLGVGAMVLWQGGDKAVAGLAIFGGLFHLFNHATYKSLLFLGSGAIEYATGTRELAKLGGLKRRMPVTGFCTRIAALSISGVPPLNGFWSKLVIVIAIIKAGHPVLAAATVFVSFLTLTLFIKVQRSVLDGPVPEGLQNVREVPALMYAPMVVLALVCVVAGVVLLVGPMQYLLVGAARDALIDGLSYARHALGG